MDLPALPILDGTYRILDRNDIRHKQVTLVGESFGRNAARSKADAQSSRKTSLLPDIRILRAVQLACFDRLKGVLLAIVAKDDQLANQSLGFGNVDRSECH